MLLQTAVLCLMAVSFVACHQNNETVSEPAISELTTENLTTTSEPQATEGVAPGSTNGPVTSSTNPENRTETMPTVTSADSCICTPYWLCNKTYQEAGIDLHVIVDEPCENYLELCCEPSEIITQEPTTPAIPTSAKGIRCGRRNPEGVSPTVKPIRDEDRVSEYGEFPWMVAVYSIEENGTKTDAYQCGGSLIHPEVVLTTAHCVTGANKLYKIRAGDWDTRSEKEALPHQDREVSSIVVHPQYYKKGLYNDIALLFLKAPVAIAANVDVVCLPPQNKVNDNTRCLTSGWGRTFFGKGTGILQKVDLPIVARDACLEALKKTRLGERFALHSSFICAGGEAEKDACKGDGGSPLVCPIEGHEGRYELSGMVCWGIGGCGIKDLPGVYVNVAAFRDWIDDQMTAKKLEAAYQY